MRLLMLRSVLVATDFGVGSEAALRTAAELATLAGAELHLLHVASIPIPDGVARLAEQFARIAPDSPAPASVQVLLGTPASVIVEQAVRIAADAVIFGPHNSGKAGIGSTASQVVSTAPCPCLVAATEMRLPLGRVLAAIDVSEAADSTLRVALSWSSALRPRQGHTRLTALHVVPDTAATAMAARSIREEVERARHHAGEAAHVDINEAIARGSDPAQTILREAASEPPDLLVIGTRGATGTARELGSVSAAVARATPCPLLMVPPQ